jgi:hypothetical protein
MVNHHLRKVLYPQMQMDGVRVLVAVADEAAARRLLAVDDHAGPDGGS